MLLYTGKSGKALLKGDFGAENLASSSTIPGPASAALEIC